MKKTNYLHTMLFVCLSLYAYGQAESSTQNLDQVTITATKFSKSMHETGKVIIVIDSTQLQNVAGKNVAQLLNEQSGLIINAAESNPSQNKGVFLQGAAGKYTLILMDGVPIYDASGSGGSFDIRMLNATDIERIEILKGSQSTLYGTDAIAGVINIITKKEGTKKLSPAGAVSYGSFNTLTANGSVQGKIGKVGYTAGYTRGQSDGISEAKEVGEMPFDRDSYFSNSVSTSASIDIIPDMKVQPFFRSTFFHGKYDNGSFSDNADAVYNSQYYNYGVLGNYKRTHSHLSFSHARTDVDRTFTDTGTEYPFRGKYNQTEIFYGYKLSKMWRLAGGMSYQRLRITQDISTQPEEKKIHIASPYASLYYLHSNGLSLEIGGRYNNHSLFGNAFTYSFNPSWNIHPIKFFFNFSTGFKAPTLTDLYSPWVGNVELKPERSKSIETGLQYFIPMIAGQIRMVFFKRNIEDIIVYQNNHLINFDEQNDWGIEIEPQIQLTDHFSVRGHYTYVTGKVTTINSAGEKNEYYNLIRYPKHTMSLFLNYHISSQWTINTGIKTFGERNDLFFDTIDFTSKTVRLSAYQLIDASIYYALKNKDIRFFVRGNNLLNQDYMEVYGFNAMPITVTVGTNFKL